MDAFGLYLMFSMLATQVLPSPNKRVEYPLGLLPCRIFQGETYRSLSRIIRNMVLMYPGGDIRYEQSGLSDARDYIEQCFLYDEFRPASHLGLASFFRVMETISYHGPRNFLIPKQKFYENLQITPALKKSFVDQIKVIHWKNKIAATTVNLAPGEQVTELEVFVIRLNEGLLDEAVLRQIDREIPYHILFLLEYEGKVQAWIGYKETSGSGNTAFKVNRYYHTDWVLPQELPLRMEGLTIDAVYENFVRQIAGDALEGGQSETLKESVDRSEKKAKLEKQIAAIQSKMRKEKQLNVQMKLNAELKALKKELEEI